MSVTCHDVLQVEAYLDSYKPSFDTSAGKGDKPWCVTFFFCEFQFAKQKIVAYPLGNFLYKMGDVRRFTNCHFVRKKIVPRPWGILGTCPWKLILFTALAMIFHLRLIFLLRLEWPWAHLLRAFALRSHWFSTWRCRNLAVKFYQLLGSDALMSNWVLMAKWLGWDLPWISSQNDWNQELALEKNILCRFYRVFFLLFGYLRILQKWFDIVSQHRFCLTEIWLPGGSSHLEPYGGLHRNSLHTPSAFVWPKRCFHHNMSWTSSLKVQARLQWVQIHCSFPFRTQGLNNWLYLWKVTRVGKLSSWSFIEKLEAFFSIKQPLPGR